MEVNLQIAPAAVKIVSNFYALETTATAYTSDYDRIDIHVDMKFDATIVITRLPFTASAPTHPISLCRHQNIERTVLFPNHLVFYTPDKNSRMKLTFITEAGLKSKTVIRDTAAAVGDLIRFIYDNGPPEHKTALDNFLKEPDPQGWEKTKWLVDAAIKLVGTDPQMSSKVKLWHQLKNMTSPIVTAAIYDIDPNQAKGTPLQELVFSKGIRDKYKLALGPQGYVGTMANVGEIGTNKLRDMLRTLSKSGAAIAKAAKKDIPTVKPLPKF